ncbi:MAG TPA: hypothetical protein VFE47_17265, partial [Tepidisphaeraceae bacterium]|nr:hypothetical protein [Tepidisphaeraceae bacterium]
MQGWMKKNQRKLLAVMGAFLMVSFLISVPVSSLTGGGRGQGAVIGHIGKTEVYSEERKEAENEWRMLQQGLIFNREEGRIGRAGELVGPVIYNEIQAHSDLFMLLVKEAEQRGIGISDDVVKTALKTEIFQGPANDPAFDTAVRHLLMVRALRDQLVSDVKFSEPLWKHASAAENTDVRLKLVEFNAPYIGRSIAEPTTQQVEKLFDQYKNTLPGAAAAPANPLEKPAEGLTFGYEVPDRVKLQYVTISRDDILKAVEEKHRDPKDPAGALPYDLKVKALEYYLKNESDFVRLPPATKPTTAPSDLAPSTGPSTAPAEPGVAVPSTQPAKPTAAGATQPTALAAATTQPAASSPTTQPTAVAGAPTSATTQPAAIAT